MATNTAWATSLLDKAAAIVEVEWTRLQQGAALSERESADLSAEMPAPRPGPPRVSATTTQRRRPGPPMPEDPRRWPTREWPPRRRYGLPPNDLLRRPRCPVRKALSDSGGDATPMITTRQRLLCRPQTIQMSRHRGRLQRAESAGAHAPPLVVAYSKWAVHPSLPSPGRPRDGFRPALAATRAFHANEHQ
jgi:hypothetical protein